jgi:glycosyltransferase involved in cell wall biosynthesis
VVKDLHEPSNRSAVGVAIPKVSAVIPALNEADNLRVLMPALPTWIYEVIIVDGCSADDTVAVARSFEKDIPVRIVNEPRRGKGTALHAGFTAAEGDIIVAMDADCSMHPREILVLVSALLAGADFAKGSRFVQGGGTSDMTMVRMIGNRGLTQIVRWLYGGAFSDLCYGYFAFWKCHLDVLDPTCPGFEVETFVKLQALKAKLKIAEVPSFESERIYGRSNLRAASDGLRVLKTIISQRFAAARPIGGARPQLVSIAWHQTGSTNELDRRLS